MIFSAFSPIGSLINNFKNWVVSYNVNKHTYCLTDPNIIDTILKIGMYFLAENPVQ